MCVHTEKPMEPKPTYDIDMLARKAAELEQAVLHLCAGCADAIWQVGEIKAALDEEAFDKLFVASDWLRQWIGRAHNVGGLLALLYGYAELCREAGTGEKEEH